MVEFGSQRQISGWLSFVVRSVTRNSLVVKTNPLERTINKVIEFPLEIRKSREGQSIDPTGPCLVSRKDGFVDDGDRMPLLRERRRRRGTARAGADDQNINSDAHYSYQLCLDSRISYP